MNLCQYENSKSSGCYHPLRGFKTISQLSNNEYLIIKCDSFPREKGVFVNMNSLLGMDSLIEIEYIVLKDDRSDYFLNFCSDVIFSNIQQEAIRTKIRKGSFKSSFYSKGIYSEPCISILLENLLLVEGDERIREIDFEISNLKLSSSE